MAKEELDTKKLRKLLDEKEKQEKQQKKKEKDKTDNKKWYERFFNKEKLKKTNKVAVVYLRNNGLADFLEVDNINDEFNVYGKKYHVDRDCIYATKKDRIPLAIIREWDVAPLGTKRWYNTEGIEKIDDVMRERFAQLEKHVLRGIKNAELYKSAGEEKGFGNFSAKQIVIYIIIAFVIGAIAIGYM